MDAPEDALRAARLPQDKVNSIFRRARTAKSTTLISGSVILPLFIGGGQLLEYNRARFHTLAGLMGTLAFICVFIWIFTTRASKITAEAAAAMQRRLVELDQHNSH
jgi:hypothetical protein